jgi:hypothetical protein
MRVARIGCAVLLAVAASGCGGGEEAEPVDTAATVDTMANLDATTAITLTLAGGPNAGTYTVGSDEALCSVGANEANQWHVQMVDDTATSGLGALAIIIPDTTAAAAGTSVFNFSAVIGSMMQGTDYTIESRPQTQRIGRGTARVVDTGSGATITIDGVARDSIQVQARIDCRRVRRGR